MISLFILLQIPYYAPFLLLHRDLVGQVVTNNKLRSVFDPCSLPFSSLLKRYYFHKLANTNSQTAYSFLLPMCLLLCDYLHCCCCLPPCLLIVLVLHFKFPRLRCSCISINKLHHSPCRTMAPILPRTPSHNGSSGLKQLEGT